MEEADASMGVQEAKKPVVVDLVSDETPLG